MAHATDRGITWFLGFDGILHVRLQLDSCGRVLVELIEEVSGVVFSLTQLNIVELVVSSLTD